ncbi:MAG TPA: DUF1003 domain-containing protein [Balneolales bacterium]|jgi:uncharacterized membrane protein|nr:DUF1003 domain-containing protein [Balneolales bacterium]
MDTGNQKPRPSQVRQLLAKGYRNLSIQERKLVRSVSQTFQLSSRNTNEAFHDQLTMGQSVADKVAAFGGSWPFIFIFAGILIIWVILNSVILVKYHNSFDPYPYILLNLFLSMLAAIQAPVIMMSQNRQVAKDRMQADNDYAVNLKAELEILQLHEKIDDLREQKWMDLVKMQQEQIEILQKLLQEKSD